MRRLTVVFSLIGLFLICGFLPLVAQADGPIVGEIRIWATGNPPDGWVVCDGQMLSRAAYPGLYDVIGTTYGNTTDYNFGVPDTEGAVVVGQADFGTNFDVLGETGGEISHTLTIAEMPSHRHSDDRGVTSGSAWGNGAAYYALAPNLGATGGALVSTYTGGDGAHNNLQPYITLNYIIFTGVYQNPTPTPTPTDTPTATPTATATITPTATLTNAAYLPYISAYTTTLRSGKILTVPVYVNLGQYVAGGVILSLLTVFALHFLFRLVYRR